MRRQRCSLLALTAEALAATTLTTTVQARMHLTPCSHAVYLMAGVKRLATFHCEGDCSVALENKVPKVTCSSSGGFSV
jgi:hypothetical protein